MRLRALYRIPTLFVPLCFLSLTVSANTSPIPGTERVSVSSTGAQGHHESSGGGISADGRYVAFSTMSNNFLDIDQNDTKLDVFVHDRQTKSTTIVSLSSDGTQGNESSSSADISADGRYVAFSSWSTNLVNAPVNGGIFVHDRQTKQTVLVSVASDGTPADDISVAPSISADGRYVAFTSKARNLVSNDTVFDDIFIHDRDTDNDGLFDEPVAISTSRVSQSSSGTPAQGNSYVSDISDDGRYVVFSSTANTLTSDDTNVQSDIFVHDRQTGTTDLASYTKSLDGYGDVGTPSISGDGRFVAYVRSFAVFVYDRQTKQTALVSPSPHQSAAYGNSQLPTISRTGRYVTFQTTSEQLLDSYGEMIMAAVVHDRDTDGDGVFDEPGAIAISYVARATDGFRTPMYDMYPQISPTGRYILFDSQATTLVVNDTNDDPDTFVQDRQAVQFSHASYLVDERAESATITVSLASFEGTVTVNYATSSGSATAEHDYRPVSGTLTFAPGETTKTFDIPLIDDTRSEIGETILLTLSNPSNAVLGDRHQSTLMIGASEGVYLPSIQR